MKKNLKLAALLAAAVTVAGCASAGYPSTEDRIKAVEKTMAAEQLSGQRSDSRDKRFFDWTGVKPAPEAPPKK